MFFDVHAHLTHDSFTDDLPAVIARAKSVIIHCAGSGLVDNERVLDLADKYLNVLPSLGLYPWDCVELTEAEVDLVMEQIKKHQRRIMCIGEVGLDHHWGKARGDHEKQEWVFDNFLTLAEDLSKPVLVHTRRAESECLGLLREHEARAIIHSYTGPQKLVSGFLERGCYFSIPSIVVRSSSFQDLVRKVPIDRLLTETDAPFMAPIIGQRSEPVNVKDGLKKIAELKGLSLKEVEQVLTNNYNKLFK